MAGLLERLITMRLPRTRRSRVSDGVHPSDMMGWLSGWAGSRKVAGVDMDEWRMLTLSTVWTCISSISADVAKLPMHLYRRQEPAGRVKAKDHPSYRIFISEPNPEMTPITAKQILMQHALRLGNGYGEITINGKGRRQVWPLKSWRMRVTRATDGSLRYTYVTDSGKEQVFRSDEIFHVRGMGDGVIGYSVVRWAMRSMGVAVAAEEHAASTWENQAVPPLVLKHPGKLSPQAQENVRKSWNETYGGADNAGNAAVLPEGMSVEMLAQNNVEAQFLESRKFSIAEICRWFRFPPHMAGDLDRATFSNIEHMSLQYVTNCLMYWIEVFEQESDRKLLDAEERDSLYFEHTVDALLRGDAKSRAEAEGMRLNNGTLTINEARDMENRNPIEIPGGDVPRVPVNTVPIDRWREGTQPDPNSPIPNDPASSPTGQDPSPGDPPAADPAAADPTSPDPAASRQMFLEAIAEVAMTCIRYRMAGWLRLEADKARRAAKIGALTAWMDEFYGGHRDYIRGAMLEDLEACSNAWKVLAAPPTVDLAALAASIADDHVARSREDLVRPGAVIGQVLDGWNTDGARFKAQSAAIQAKIVDHFLKGCTSCP